MGDGLFCLTMVSASRMENGLTGVYYFMLENIWCYVGCSSNKFSSLCLFFGSAAVSVVQFC